MSSVLRPCLICTAPTNFAHLGINSCRSCSDFYRRTVAANRSFICRQGDGQCTIKPKDRHNCRGCRFERCEKFGMKVEKESTSEQAPTTSTNATFHSRILREYSASVARRKIYEYSLQPTALHRHVRADFEGECLLLCTWSYLIKFIHICAGELMNYAKTVFPEFAALSLEDQLLMLKYSATVCYLMEKHSNTYIKFKSHDSPIYMSTLTTVYDERRFEFFTEEAGPQLSNHIAKHMLFNKTKIRRIVEPILKRSQFTETEYAIAFALSIWQIDPSEILPDHLIDVCYSVRRQLFGALRDYYTKELGLTDYSVRLGNLITYEHVVQETKNCLNDEVQTYNLLGILDQDIALFEKVMTISL